MTAQKRTERLQDVPVPVTAVSAQSLITNQSVQLRDYVAQIPGVSINTRGSGRASLAIRGISTGIFNNPTVGIVLDDIPLGSSTSAGVGDTIAPDFDPSDLERVEVLRGPQGTLYGAASLGGLIKFVGKAPDTNAFSGRAEVMGQTAAHGDDGYGVRGSVNVPLAQDTIGIRVSGYYRRDPGFIDDPKQGRKNVDATKAYGGRAAFIWNVSPSVSARLAVTVQDAKADAASAQDVLLDGTPAIGVRQHRRAFGTDGYHEKMRVIGGSINADLGGANLTSVTGYSYISHDAPQDTTKTYSRFTGTFFGVPNQDVRLLFYTRTEKFSQEVRLASDPGQSFEWLVGGFFTKEWSYVAQTLIPQDPATGVPIVIAPRIMYDGKTTSHYREIAGFGDVTYHFTEKFDLQAGARYSTNRQKEFGYADGLLNGGRLNFNSGSKDNSFTFLVTPRYRFSRDAMLYARVASGYRPGGFNRSAPANVPQTFDPDRTINYDIGFKASIQRMLTVDLSVFRIDWDKIQLRTIASNGFGYKGNGGKARSQGFEASATVKPVTGLSITGNLSYTDAKLTRNTPVGLFGLKGDPLPFIGKWAGSIIADQSFAVTDSVMASVGATFTYVDNRLGEFPTSSTTPRFQVPSYTTLDLRAGIEQGRWSINMFVKNVTDKLGYLSGAARDSITRTGEFEAGLVRPRTFGVNIARTF